MVTHNHLDHLLGIFCLLRMILSQWVAQNYEGELVIYSHEEVIELLHDMVMRLFPEKMTYFIGKKVHLFCVQDQEKKKILNHPITFYDIHSIKAKQFVL